MEMDHLDGSIAHGTSCRIQQNSGDHPIGMPVGIRDYVFGCEAPRCSSGHEENTTMELTSKKPCRSASVSGATTPSTLPRLLYSRTQAAYQWSLSVRAVDYMIAQGKVRVRRIGGRILIPYSELLRLARTDQIERITPCSSSAASAAA
jgi:hypothetical protein